MCLIWTFRGLGVGRTYQFSLQFDQLSKSDAQQLGINSKVSPVSIPQPPPLPLQEAAQTYREEHTYIPVGVGAGLVGLGPWPSEAQECGLSTEPSPFW